MSDPIRAITGLGPDELESIYLEYKDKVSAYIRRRINSASDAEDLLSCVFMELSKNAGAYDSEKSSLSTWIYAITCNLVNYHLRGVYRAGPGAAYEELPEDLADGGPDIEEGLIRSEQLGSLASALELLPRREKEIIVLRFYYNKPSREVAGLMDLSDENVRYLQNKALKKLRELMAAGER